MIGGSGHSFAGARRSGCRCSRRSRVPGPTLPAGQLRGGTAVLPGPEAGVQPHGSRYGVRSRCRRRGRRLGSGVRGGAHRSVAAAARDAVEDTAHPTSSCLRCGGSGLIAFCTARTTASSIPPTSTATIAPRWAPDHMGATDPRGLRHASVTPARARAHCVRELPAGDDGVTRRVLGGGGRIPRTS